MSAEHVGPPPMPSDLSVGLLGHVVVESAQGRLAAFESPRLQRLLAMVILDRGAPRSRVHAAMLLWPDSTEAQAQTNLRHLLHDLRKALPDADRYLEVTNRAMRWRVDGPAAVDVLTFTDAIARGDLHAAVAAYGGDLLPSCYDDWVLTERDRLRAAASEAATALVEEAAAAGCHRDALGRAQRALDLDPFNERAHRAVILAHAALGDRAAAVRAYQACTELLERELGVPPSPETSEVYTRVSTAVAMRAQDRTRVRVPGPPLVGREAAWAEATAAWERAAAGSAGVLVVTGEAGVGKTRLVEELSRACASGGSPLARTRAYEAAGRAPWAPVVDWLRARPVAEAAAGLDDGRLAELSRLVPELRAARPDLPSPTPATDAAQRYRMLDAVAAALARAGAPLLLVVDDVQWCDADTLDLIGFLVRAHADAPLLVAATARAEEIGDADRLRALMTELRRDDALTEIALDRLDEQGTSQLAAQVLERPLEPEAAAALFRETEGNPLFIVEAMRAGRPRTGALSPTVHAMISARLNQLSPLAREVAEVAATVGRDFTVDVLGEACRADSDDLDGALDELWQRRIIREQGTGYDFTHDKIREVGYSALGPARRRRLHRDVANAIRTVHRDDLAPVSARLAVHYEEAGLPLDAIGAHRAAAAAALGLFALDDAIAWLRRALALVEHLPVGERRDALELELRVELGVPLVAREGYGSEAATAGYQRAVALSRRLGRPVSAPVLRGLGLSALTSCEFGTSTKCAAQLLELGTSDPVAATEGHYLLGVSAFWQGRLSESRLHLSAALAAYQPQLAVEHIARYAQDPKAVCLVRLGITELWLGDLREAAPLVEEALAFARALDHPMTSAYVHVYAALVAAETGDVERVSELLDAGDAIWAQRFDLLAFMGYSLRVWADAMSGKGAGALLGAVDSWRETQQTLHLTYSLSLLARYCVATGDTAAGRLAVREALAWTDAHGQRYLEAELRRVEGELLALDGDRAAAVAEVEAALRVARSQEARHLELRAASTLARLAPHRMPPERLQGVLDGVRPGDGSADVAAARALLG